MSKNYTHTAAYAHFGVKPRNVQWSWSARSEDGKTVVVTLWQDHFIRENGRVIQDMPAASPTLARRPGFNELMENLQWAQEHNDGCFNVIVAIAKDVNADPRSIAECFPSKMVMKLTRFDRSSGKYTAEAVGL